MKGKGGPAAGRAPCEGTAPEWDGRAVKGRPGGGTGAVKERGGPAAGRAPEQGGRREGASVKGRGRPLTAPVKGSAVPSPAPPCACGGQRGEDLGRCLNYFSSV